MWQNRQLICGQWGRRERILSGSNLTLRNKNLRKCWCSLKLLRVRSVFNSRLTFDSYVIRGKSHTILSSSFFIAEYEHKPLMLKSCCCDILKSITACKNVFKTTEQRVDPKSDPDWTCVNVCEKGLHTALSRPSSEFLIQKKIKNQYKQRSKSKWRYSSQCPAWYLIHFRPKIKNSV